MVDDGCQLYQEVQPHAEGARGGHQATARTQRELQAKLHRATDAQGQPIRMGLTEGTAADCTHAADRIEDLEGEHRVADRGYDSEAVLEPAEAQERVPVIPPRRTRQQSRAYDRDLY